jgi:hypothetical protein
VKASVAIRFGDRMLSGIGVIPWVADTYNPAGHTPSRPLPGNHVSHRRLIRINHSIYGNGRKMAGTNRHDYDSLLRAQRGNRVSRVCGVLLSFQQHR